MSAPAPPRLDAGPEAGPLAAPPPARPSGAQPVPAPMPGSRRRPVSEGVLTLALALVALAAIVPLRGVFIGTEWVRPVAGGVVLAIGIGWGSRRLDVGPITHLLMSAGSLLLFCTIAFLPSTAIAGVVPTPATLGALQQLFARGLELVELRPSPTFAEAGLLLLAVAGTWIMTYLADGLLFVLRSPAKAVLAALVTWSVPLAVAPAADAVGLPAAAMLTAAVVLLLLGSAEHTAGWGLSVAAPGADGRERQPRAVPLIGWAVGAGAVLAGLMLAGVLPGYGAPALVEARGGSGTTITTNPIVDIRSRLVAGDSGPIALVESPRPLYLRTTSLDAYDEDEQWTAGTISGERVQGVVDVPPDIPREPVEVGITIAASIESGAVLAPAPYQPIEVSGPRARDLRYDARSATLTAPGDAPLQPTDSYRVLAAVPAPNPDALRTIAPPPPGSPLTQLPANVPQEVRDLARQIVDEAGATTMFDQALAIQDRLRTWGYSTTPEPGTGATAMLRFIDAQEGYCEQFAGTMAVMLRSLGIPTRLAVGYTPGVLQPDQTWRITNANAHAWVEVDFGPMGFVTFEPTPRSDGNVLVTSGSAIVPAQTLAQQEGAAPSAGAVGPGELAGLRPTQQPAVPSEDPFALAPDASPPAEGAEQGGVPWLLLLALLATAGVGGTVLVRRGGAVDVTAPPQVRIATARARVEHVGRAVGRGRSPAETDVEYLTRIADGHRAGQALASPATRAVYAPAVTAEEADAAERAAQVLAHRLTDDLPAWRRAAVRTWLSIRAVLHR